MGGRQIEDTLHLRLITHPLEHLRTEPGQPPFLLVGQASNFPPPGQPLQTRVYTRVYTRVCTRVYTRVLPFRYGYPNPRFTEWTTIKIANPWFTPSDRLCPTPGQIQPPVINPRCRVLSTSTYCAIQHCLWAQARARAQKVPRGAGPVLSPAALFGSDNPCQCLSLSSAVCVAGL